MKVIANNRESSVRGWKMLPSPNTDLLEQSALAFLHAMLYLYIMEFPRSGLHHIPYNHTEFAVPK